MVQNCVLVELDHFPLPLLWGKAGSGLAGEFEIVNCLSVKNLFNLTDEKYPARRTQTYQNLETWNKASLRWARNKAVAENAFIKPALISLTSAVPWLLQCKDGDCATMQLVKMFHQQLRLPT